MTKLEFIEFIKELGFDQVWQTNPDHYALTTDVIGLPSANYHAFCDQLNIHFDGENDLIHLSLTQQNNHMTTGKSFGNFSLKTFGVKDDLQIQIFMSFIKSAFKNPPSIISQYMRDKKIVDILNNP